MLESFVVTNSLLFMLSSHDCIYINFREIIYFVSRREDQRLVGIRMQKNATDAQPVSLR